MPENIAGWLVFGWVRDLSDARSLGDPTTRFGSLGMTLVILLGLMGFHVFAQELVNAGLVALTLGFEPC